MNVTARAEIASGAGEHDDAHLRCRRQRPKQVAELCIGIERQRVLPLGPVERYRADAVIEPPPEMSGFEGLRIEAHAVVPPSMVMAAPFTSRLCGRQSVRIMGAIASGCTSRPLAFIPLIASRDCSWSRLETRAMRSIVSSVIGVSTKLGQTALTVRLVLANSAARLRISPTMPCLEAA